MRGAASALHCAEHLNVSAGQSLNAGNGSNPWRTRMAPRGAEARGDAAVGVLLHLEGLVLKGLSRPVCSLLGQAKVNVGAAETPQPGP